MSDFDDRVAEAGRQLAAGNPQRAYAALRPVFAGSALAEDRAHFVEALRMLGTIAQAIAGPQFVALLHEVTQAPDDPGRLYALGYECLEQQLRLPAACALQRALPRSPDKAPVLAELVTALESDGRHEEARAYLRGATELLDQHFELRYLLAFNTLMSGDLAAARRCAESLGSASGPEQAAMQGRLTEMLTRADAAARVSPLDHRDLRGWHFVTSGGLLLHLSPFGFAEGMNGRYAMTQDSAVRCRQGLLRLHAVLDEWDQAPSRVLLLPDRDSHVLGMAAAAMYGVPAEPFEEDTPGLVVAYDLSTLDPSTPAAVAHHHPEQVLFAHATCWTDPPPCVPDLTTYLYQVNVAPGHDEEDEAPKAPAPANPDDATIEVAVQAILDAIVDDDPDELPSDKLPNLVSFSDAVRPASAAAKSEGLRAPMWEGGPVPSNRFG